MTAKASAAGSSTSSSIGRMAIDHLQAQLPEAGYLERKLIKAGGVGGYAPRPLGVQGDYSGLAERKLKPKPPERAIWILRVSEAVTVERVMVYA